MQSHASRHVVSEHLCDRHLVPDTEFPKGVLPTEIATAYGERCIPKLVALLNLPPGELSDSERCRALSLLLAQLPTQEQKVGAIRGGALQPLLFHLSAHAASPTLKALAAKALLSCCALEEGRRVLLVELRGLQLLVDQLRVSPAAVAPILRTLAASRDGHTILEGPEGKGLVPALVELTGSPAVDFDCLATVADTLAHMCRRELGATTCLSNDVPAVLVSLVKRVVIHRVTPESTSLLALQRGALAGLAQLAAHSGGKTALRLAQAIPALAVALRSCDVACRRAAAAALAGVAVDPEAKVEVMVVAGDALIMVAQSDSDAVVVAGCKDALLNAAEHLDARRKLELKLPRGELKALLGVLGPTPPSYRYVIFANDLLLKDGGESSLGEATAAVASPSAGAADHYVGDPSDPVTDRPLSALVSVRSSRSTRGPKSEASQGSVGGDTPRSSRGDNHQQQQRPHQEPSAAAAAAADSSATAAVDSSSGPEVDMERPGAGHSGSSGGAAAESAASSRGSSGGDTSS